MAKGTVIFLCLALATALAFPAAKEAELVTEPKPGDEFVFVQSTDSDARPISRKDKVSEEARPFETSHKLPSSLTFARKQGDVEKKPSKPGKPSKRVQKREANPQGAAPPPAGAIKLDVRALLKKYETELKTSTTAKPKVTSTTTKSGRRRGANKRIKKEAKQEAFQVTSPSPVLTTAKNTPKKVDDDDDIPLLGAASEKQRSRIQVKKGPNGQEYEYEYVYYYYDDEEDAKDKKVTNAHDGPARNQITRGEKTREKATPEANEVVPPRGSKTRGRQLGEEETVNEERLPANTRFPPRSRNLNTTPIPEEETTRAVTRGRGRGRPTTEAAPSSSSEVDSASDETQGTRGRTRANVRRPSLDLVDSDSFNTHSANSGKPVFPQDLPEGPEEEESEDKADKEEITESKDKHDEEQGEEEEESTSPLAEEGTTVMSAMDKVALDLYAISQGTQKLFGEGEDAESSTENEKTSSTEESEATTEPITETPEPETTTVTTTTTTTTTTPAPTTTTTTTTTTTEAAPFGRGKFGGRRGGIGGRKTTAHASTTEAAQSESKPKGKFGRPSFGGRARPGSKSTAAPAVEEEAHKEESKPASHSRPSLNRGRFGSSRPRGRTPAATEEPKEESSGSSTSAPSHRPSLPRARPSFNLRTRGRTTAAPATDEEQPSDESSSPTTEASSSTTAKGRRIGAPGVRPLRPGPRINLTARGRPGAATTTTTTEAPAEDQVAEAEEEHETPDQEASEKEETPAAPVDNSPLGRLRNKNRINVQNRPKAAASAPVQVRRVNPLIARRRPGQTTEAPSSEAPQESPATEEAESTDEDGTEAAPSSTTEEPKGLNKLLAGRRRPGVRTPGTLAHRT